MRDVGFRVSLGLLLGGFVAHRAYYHRRFDPGPAESNAGGARTVASVLALTGLIASAAYLVEPGLVSWAALPLPAWLRWLGGAAALGGVALLTWAHRSLGASWSDAPRLAADHHLVTSGPYRYVRHPIYTAFLLILGAPLLLSANWLIGGAWLGMTAIEVAARVSIEEALLLSRFGDRYRLYKATTGALLPRLRPDR
jgi:protein-S-isoprenylcysteine O-methyltransferase Ste14